MQNPINAKPIQIAANDSAKPSVIQTIVSGMLTIKMAFRRPNFSQIAPLNKQPTGCTINEKLAENHLNFNWICFCYSAIFGRFLQSHDVWAPVNWTVSFWLTSFFMPVNDGITIDRNPLNAPIFSNMKFLAIAAKIWIFTLVNWN